MSQPEEQGALLERLRHATNKAAKSGKPELNAAGIQELLQFVGGDLQQPVLIVTALKLLEDMLGAPNAVTILRLEGGLKVLPRLLRTWSMEPLALAACARVISRCVANNTASQVALARERAIAPALLNALAANSRDPQVVLPVMELVAGLSRTLRGAQSLAGETMVTLTKDLLLHFMGQWNVFGMVLKALKLQAKHESCATCLMRVGNGEVSHMLLAVARLLTRLPAQQKVLKRVSRTLWLLHRNVLPSLPDLEPLVPLPFRDSPHLNLPAAPECADSSRLMELVPEEFCAELQAAGQVSPSLTPGSLAAALPPMCPARPVRPTCRADVSWPLATDLIPQEGIQLPPGQPEPFHDCGSALEIDMMMHDIRRLVYPNVLQLKQVYNSLATSGATTDQEPGGVPPVLTDPSAPLTPDKPPGTAYGDLLLGAATSSCGDQLGPAGRRPQLQDGGNKFSALPALRFDSRFESGNLRAAHQVYDNEYDLFLAADLNDRTDGGNLCQWFYFSVGNVQPGVPYKFNLVNLRKKQSLFGSGKQPLVCLLPPSQHPGDSTAQAPVASPPPVATQPAQEPGSALVNVYEAGRWVRAGACVAYYPSPYRGRPLNPPPIVSTSSSAASGDLQTRRSASKKAPIKRVGRTGPPAPGQLTPPTPPTGLRDGKEAAALELAPVGPGLYCATFTLVFPQAGTYLVASCYPYTYTRLQEYLHGLCTRLATRSLSCRPLDPSTPEASSLEPAISPAPAPPLSLPLLLDGLLVRSLLCYTLTGHAVELLTVTDFLAPPDVVASREVVVMTARVHPGETCASWIMQGVIDFLTSQHPAACMLRSSFVFKLVPMLNPDGVVNGSYRCSLAGCDLNRTWERPCRSVQPSVFHTKKLLQALAAGGVGRLALFLDIHGHSSKEDAFFYGCEPNLSGFPGSGGTAPSRQSTPARTPGSSGALAEQDTDRCSAGASPGAQQQGAGPGPGQGANGSINPRVAARLRVRMLPYLLARGSNSWSFTKSSFRIRKAKLGAARVVVHRELGCAGAYTLEASLGGRSSNRTHFTMHDYVTMGNELCRGIAELAEVDDTALLEEMATSVSLTPYTPAYTV